MRQSWVVRAGAVPRPIAGEQARLAARVVVDEDRGFADAGQGHERGLDLGGFDPESAEFDLVVGAAHVVRLAVGQASGEVSGAVDPFAGHERVGQEAFLGEVGAAEIAAGQRRSAEVHLPHHAGRDGFHAPVEDVHTGAGQRAADGAGPLQWAGVVVRGAVEGRFGGAVAEADPQAGEVLCHAVQGGFGERLDSREQRAQLEPVQSYGRVLVDPLDVRGRQEGLGHGVFAHPRQQGLGVAAQLLGDDVQFTAGGEGQQQFVDRGVEADAGPGRADLAGGGAHAGVPGGEEVEDAAVLDRDALGPSRGPGGEDHVGESVGRGSDARGRFVAGCSLGFHSCQVEPLRGAFRAVVVTQHEGAGRVLDHVREAFGGLARVEREVGSARLEDAQDADGKVAGPLRVEADDVAGADGTGDEGVREVVGAAVEGRVVQQAVAADDGGAGRTLADLGLEEFDEPGGRVRSGPGGLRPRGVAVEQLAPAVPEGTSTPARGAHVRGGVSCR